MSDGQIRRARKTYAVGDLGRPSRSPEALNHQYWAKLKTKRRAAAKRAKQASKLNRK